MARASLPIDALDDLDRREALAVEPGELVARPCGDDPAAHRRREGAVDDRRLEIDDRDGGDDAHGARLVGGLLDPVVELGADLAPVVGRAPQMRRVRPAAMQLFSSM